MNDTKAPLVLFSLLVPQGNGKLHFLPLLALAPVPSGLVSQFLSPAHGRIDMDST